MTGRKKTFTLDADAAAIVEQWGHNERGKRASAAIRHFASQEGHIGPLVGRVTTLEAELRTVRTALAVLTDKQG